MMFDPLKHFFLWNVVSTTHEDVAFISRNELNSLESFKRMREKKGNVGPGFKYVDIPF
jgi:hypothetical protein